MAKELIKAIDKIWTIKHPSELQNHIDSLAESILLNYQLKLNESLFDITEIEFYINKADHQDPFVHQHSGFKTGQFRIHGAGIDIALGDGENYGGILFRSIRKIGQEKLIPSPIKVFDAIIKNMGDIESSTIAIIPKNSKSSESIYCTPRIGLNTKNKVFTENQVQYLVSPYRFFTADQLNAEKYIKALVLGIEEGLDTSTLREYKKNFEAGKQMLDPLVVTTGYFRVTDKAKLLGYYSLNKQH